MVEFSKTVSDPNVCPNPSVLPVLNVPPFKLMFEELGRQFAEPSLSVPFVIVVVPE